MLCFSNNVIFKGITDCIQIQSKDKVYMQNEFWENNAKNWSRLKGRRKEWILLGMRMDEGQGMEGKDFNVGREGLRLMSFGLWRSG